MNLPNVFQNKNINNTNNSQEYFYGIEKNKIPSRKTDINSKIKQLFQSPNYVYKIDVIITTKHSTIERTIIGKSRNYLITIDNETININDIIDINEKD